MDAFVIEGGQRLDGTVRVSGAKNAALPLMAAAMLSEEVVTLEDVPHLSDINNMRVLLEELGCQIEHNDDGKMTFRVISEEQSHARYDLVRKMRASICVLGPMLAKRGCARVSMPGGCPIGDRPIDLHLRGLAALGAQIELDGGDICVQAKQLHGTKIFLGGPFGSTVLGTTNVMSAATIAQGTTVIEQAACEPEVVDLANLLNQMGANIQGAGTPRLTIHGVESLGGATHRVMADRIEAGTWIMTAALTNSPIQIDNCPVDTLLAVLEALKDVGIGIEMIEEDEQAMRCSIKVTSSRRLSPTRVTTQPYPGFPTDLQAQMMVLLAMADGNSIITEKIFPDRFLHVPELSRMGAKLYRQGATVVVSGEQHLIGAPVMASDLRASASLVMAGLAAKGTTRVNRVYHLDRGYEQLDKKLQSLGAVIERVAE